MNNKKTSMNIDNNCILYQSNNEVILKNCYKIVWIGYITWHLGNLVTILK